MLITQKFALGGLTHLNKGANLFWRNKTICQFIIKLALLEIIIDNSPQHILYNNKQQYTTIYNIQDTRYKTQ